MAWKVILGFDDGDTMELDELFDSYEEADEEAAQAASDYSQGCDYLEEAGEDHSDAKVVGWDIVEV